MRHNGSNNGRTTDRTMDRTMAGILHDGRGSVGLIRPKTFTACGGPYAWNTRWREPGRRSCGGCCMKRATSRRSERLTGNQAVQMAQAGLKAIYLSGWQVAADANLSGHMYPDQSLYPVNSVPAVVRGINNALMRADQIAHTEGQESIDWMLPIVADAEAGFGGVLNAFELTKAMIEAGAAGVHFEDQLSSAKKCGHMGGKVLVPAREAVQKLVAARLAADVLNVPTIIVARTDADAAQLITSDCDPVDRPFLTADRTVEGFYRFHGGLEAAIARGLAYAPWADMVWCETSEPNVEDARRFAEAILEKFPGKLLAYNCSPSFHWEGKLSHREIAAFQQELAGMGYRFQFVTLAGFHALNLSTFELAHEYRRSGMAAYSRLQEREFDLAGKYGYSAVKHQRFVGAGYFDRVATTIAAGQTSICALPGSTEEEQFEDAFEGRSEHAPTLSELRAVV